MQAKEAIILGIGGAGLNIVNKLYKQGTIGADFAAIDTSKSHIETLERGLKRLHISYSKGVKLDPCAGFILRMKLNLFERLSKRITKSHCACKQLHIWISAGVYLIRAYFLIFLIPKKDSVSRKYANISFN